MAATPLITRAEPADLAAKAGGPFLPYCYLILPKAVLGPRRPPSLMEEDQSSVEGIPISVLPLGPLNRLSNNKHQHKSEGSQAMTNSAFVMQIICFTPPTYRN